jgi:hypothetical protein
MLKAQGSWALMGSFVCVAIWLTACGSASSASFNGGASPGGSSGSSTGSGSSSGSSSVDAGASGGAGEDAAAGDAGGEAGAGDDGGAISPPPTVVILLHASPSLPSLRLCWAPTDPTVPVDATALPFPSSSAMPASNYAGIPVGGAVWADPTATQALATGGYTLYALRAKPIADSTTPCHELVCSGTGSGCLMPNADYWRVGALTPGQLRTGATNVVAIGGCLPLFDDPSASGARCGPTWSTASGNLHVDTISFYDTLAGDGGPLMVQAAQLSPGLAALEGAGATTLSFGTQDGGQIEVARLHDEGDVEPLSPMPLMLPTTASPFDDVGFAVDVVGADAGAAGHVWMSLAQAQELVLPQEDPTTYYRLGGTYVVAVLGDPNAPHAYSAGGMPYDGTGLHLLVLPAASGAP